MNDEFSAGYYVAELFIELSDYEYAVLDHDQYQKFNKQIYTTGEGVERVDLPLVMKVDKNHFPVFSTNNVPKDTLAVPDGILEATRIDNLPTAKEVLIAKAERASQLLELFTPYTWDAPVFT